jgi:diguanylate cyclase (GGDEF)-like protein/PAS domain S-box-containing protein
MKQADAINERIERFGELFASMGEAAFLIDTPSGTILACNRSAEQLTGFPCEELVGANIVDDLQIQADEDADITPETVINSMLAGQGMRFVSKKRRKDGTPFWDDIVLVPFHTEGAPVHISINHDISDRTLQERALRDSETRYRSIFESTTDAVLIFNRDSRIAEANPSAYAMYGYEPGEMIGLPASQIIHPDYYHGFSNFRSGIDRSGEFRARSVNLRKDGTPFDVEVHGARFIYREEPHLLAIARDIRGQIEAEHSLESARLKVERLHGAASHLTEATTEREVYEATVNAAQEILEFALCSLDILEGDKLVAKATSEGLPPEASVAADIQEENVAGRTYRTGQTIVFGSLAEVPDAKPTNSAFQSGISAPIGAFGVFQVASSEPNAFTGEDVRFLELLLRHTAQAIERIRLQQDLVRQAHRDPLTGTYNRRYFNQVIEQELARSKRHERTIGFLMIDVNRFKEINDTFGHQTGDAVLRAVAEILINAIREGDLVVRYGGDEFLVVLMESADGQESVQQRITEAVAERNQTNELIPFPVTLSIGYAQWSPSTHLPIETVLAKADERMYAAKRRMSGTAEPR